MSGQPDPKIELLCRSLGIDLVLFTACLDGSVIEIREEGDQFQLDNGSALRLRRLQRLCDTLEIEPQVALLLTQLVNRIAELEKKVP